MPYKYLKDQAENSKKWYAENKERIRYNHRKQSTISRWKRRGIKDAEFDLLYEYKETQTHCWICDVEYTDRYNRVLDHDHETGEVRYICCRYCNMTILKKISPP